MEVVAFSMKGEPRGKGRPRATVRGGYASVYTDPKTRKYEASVRSLAEAAMAGQAPLEGPLKAALRFRIPIPVSLSKRQRAAILAGEQAHYGRFDTDNLVKAILDPCNGVVFADDRQVIQLFAVKEPSEHPGVDVRIEPARAA